VSTTVPVWSQEFARVIGCEQCSSSTDRKLLRDEQENVPQPGWVGSNYDGTRLLLVGQNPGTPKSLATADRPYTNALRDLRDNVTEQQFQKLVSVLRSFIPQWPVHGNYFPLAESGLTLEDIAYCNIVRCRTQADSPPGTRLVANCLSLHFSRWLDLLQPRAVVFIGKWAAERGGPVVEAAGIPYRFMNRQRSLSSVERTENRNAVVQFVRAKGG
jgi:uracil-DNA glycosylase